MSKDNYGYFGPTYSFADNIPLPGEVGVRQESSISAIVDAVGGINYYVDTIAFGQRTFFDTQNPQPMGVRYYLNTDMRCSNGATMSEYIDGVTKGDILGSRVQAALASTGLPQLRGLAPGILENARDTLDPRPIFAAVSGTGYPVCQQVSCPVGDGGGATWNRATGDQYMVDPVDYNRGIPTQKRWVQAYDKKGNPINITKGEFSAQPKCYNADGSYMERPPEGCPDKEPAAASGVGSGKYKSCFLEHSPVMPPPLIPAMGEGFCSQEDSERLLMAAGIVVLLGVAVWSVVRK